MRSLPLLVFVGCTSTEQPSFEPDRIRISQGDDFDTLVESRGTPSAPPYTMHFRGGRDAIHLPDSLTVDGREMLITNADCTAESEVGIAVFPAATAAASFDGGDPTDNTDASTVNFVSVDMAGPHIGRVVVGYSLDYQCNGPQTLRGVSTFVFYPTGRIVRLDRNITPSSGVLPNTTNCSCANSFSQFTFTSYWAFRSGLVNTDRSGDVLAPDAPSTGACTIYDTRALGVQFDSSTQQPLPTSRVGSNERASHIFDFASGQAMLVNNSEDINSSIQVAEVMLDQSRERCGEVLDRLAKNVPISIGGTIYPTTLEDGFYNDDQGVRTQPFEIRPGSATPLPPGFTVSVQLPNGAAKVTRNPGHTIEPTHYVQRAFPTSNQFLFVFNEGLAGDQSILIEPL